MAESKSDAKKTTPEPVGSAASFTTTGRAAPNDSTSLPVSSRQPQAGESSDPAVHKLLADRQALQMNRDLIDPPVDTEALKAVDEQLAEVDKQLADLGYAQPSAGKTPSKTAADTESTK